MGVGVSEVHAVTWKELVVGFDGVYGIEGRELDNVVVVEFEVVVERPEEPPRLPFCDEDMVLVDDCLGLNVEEE